MSDENGITDLVRKWRAGSTEAGNRLFEEVYMRLRRSAGALLAKERRDHTLQPTEIVDEMVLRLSKNETLKFDSREDFFSCAAKIMRNILVDHARAREAARRGGGVEKIPLRDELASVDDYQLLELDNVLKRLEIVRPKAARIFELRHFVGLSLQEIVDVTDVSLATVKRRLKFATAWMGSGLGLATKPKRKS